MVALISLLSFISESRTNVELCQEGLTVRTDAGIASKISLDREAAFRSQTAASLRLDAFHTSKLVGPESVAESWIRYVPLTDYFWHSPC